LAIPDGLTQQLPAAGDEEWRLGRGAHMTGALRSVARHRLDGAWMQRHQPGLAELALADRQHAGSQVDIDIEKAQRLGDAQRSSPAPAR
jgi:hypothetical protein